MQLKQLYKLLLFILKKMGQHQKVNFILFCYFSFYGLHSYYFFLQDNITQKSLVGKNH